MRQTFHAIAILFVLTANGNASALEAAKVRAIVKAAESFVALASDSLKTGRPPRQSDPAAKPLLDLALDTSEVQGVPVLPRSVNVGAWALAVNKIYLVYALAGSGFSLAGIGVTDPLFLPKNNPDLEQKIARNTVEFAPEIGRAIDASLWLSGAGIDFFTSTLSTLPKSALNRPDFKNNIAKMQEGTFQMISGAIIMLPIDGIADAWRRDRLPALIAIGPKAAKLMLPEPMRVLRDLTFEVAGRMTDPEVKLALMAFASSLSPSGFSGAATTPTLDQRQCSAADPDTSIRGCTAVIQSGHEPRQNLAIAFSNRGDAYIHKGQPDRAIEDFEQAIRLNPNDAEAIRKRGTAYNRKGQPDRAIEDFDQAIRLNPNDAIALSNRGIAYNDKDQPDRAIEDFDHAIRLNPNDAIAFYNRGVAYGGKGQPDRAIQDFDQAIRLNPKFADAFFNRGAVYAGKGRPDRAVEDFNQAIRLNPNDAHALLARGLVKRANGDSAGGDADIAKAKRLNPRVGN